MRFKTELHAHSSEVSACANASASYLVGRYLYEGYSALVLTNHWNAETFSSPRYPRAVGKEDFTAQLSYFLDGYKKAKAAAEGTALTVLLGMELRLTREGGNDYLLYGLTEEFLRTHPELPELTLKELSALTRRNGILLVCAHPFRSGMTAVSPALVDGYEVYNGLPVENHNVLARFCAERYGKLMTSGSDFHDPENPVRGGILTEEPVRCGEQLVALLRSGAYRLMEEN